MIPCMIFRSYLRRFFVWQLRGASGSSTVRTTYNALNITLIIKALNYAKPSPAQPQPQPASPASPGKKYIILSFFFRQRYVVNTKLWCSKIEKIKLFSDQRYTVNVLKMLVLFSCFFAIKFHAFLQSEMVIQISKAIFSPWIHHPFLMKIHDFSMKFYDFS